VLGSHPGTVCRSRRSFPPVLAWARMRMLSCRTTISELSLHRWFVGSTWGMLIAICGLLVLMYNLYPDRGLESWEKRCAGQPAAGQPARQQSSKAAGCMHVLVLCELHHQACLQHWTRHHSWAALLQRRRRTRCLQAPKQMFCRRGGLSLFCCACPCCYTAIADCTCNADTGSTA
jgi:hypothetical protein